MIKYFLPVLGVINILLLIPSVIPVIFPIPGPQVIVLLFVGIYFLFLLHKKHISQLPASLSYLIFIQGVFWFLMSVYHADGSYITRIVFLVDTYLLLMCLWNIKEGIYKFVSTYNKVILWMGIGGCVAFLGVMLFNRQPLLEYVNADGRTGYFYGISCTNTKIDRFIRYSGFFDEPGSMAFWGVFALIYNILYIKNVKIERVLLVSLAFTFSLAYYIQLCVYLLAFKVKKISTIFIITSVFVGVVVFVNALQDTDYEIIYRLTLGRLEFGNDGTMTGDNRSGLMENAFEIFFQYPFLGIGATAFSNLDSYSGDNPITPFAIDGIIGGIFLYLPLLFAFPLCLKQKDSLVCWIILVIGYLQRPFSCFFIYFITMYLFFIICAYGLRKKPISCDEIFHRNSMLQCR